MQERLQKIIARAGIASRRHAEELISSGHVRVNGEVVTELGAKADPESDRVEVDGKLAERPEPAYYMLHKPVNVVSTMSDPEGRATLRHLLRGLSGGIFPVGRLDYATSGLLLLTSDGELANRIFKVSGNMPKVFWIKVKGRPSDDLLASIRHSAHAHLRLLDAPGAAKKDADNPWYEVEIGEARRDLLRRSLFAADHPVEKMKRVKIGPLDLGDLPEAHYRKLDPSEITRLRAAVERAELAPRPIRTGGKVVGPGNRRFKRLREAEKFQQAGVKSGAQRPAQPPHEEAYTPAPTWTPPRTPDQPSTWQQPTSTNLSARSIAATPWDRPNKPEETAENAPSRPSTSTFRPPNIRPAKGGASSGSRPSYKPSTGKTWRPPNKSGAGPGGRPPYRPSGGSTFRPPNKGGVASSGRPPYRPSGGSSFRPPNKSGASSSGRPPYKPSGSSSFRPPNKSGAGSSGRPPYRPSGGSSFRPPNKGGAASSGRPPYKPSGSSTFRPPNKPGAGSSGRPPYRPSGKSSFRPSNKGGEGSSGRPPRERSGSNFRPSNKSGGRSTGRPPNKSGPPSSWSGPRKPSAPRTRPPKDSNDE
jgi:23S rRNA pseudouridine2605 synthase